MKKVTHRSLTTRLSLTLLAFLLSFSTLTFGQEPAAAAVAESAEPADIALVRVEPGATQQRALPALRADAAPTVDEGRVVGPGGANQA